MHQLLTLIVLAALEVLVAMTADLGSGLYKAKLRGELHRSEALKRSIYKFLLYEGAIIVAAGMDTLIFFSEVLQHVSGGWIHGIPVITFAVALFISAVEILSIREHADEKTHAQINQVGKIANKVTAKLLDGIVEAVVERLKTDANK